jgi:glycine/D-amino acid oxidase-like deaminating enzyme
MDETETEVLDCDVLVVGAGVSGCSLTAELVRNGISVVLVESGSSSAYSHPSHQQASRWWLAATESPFARHLAPSFLLLIKFPKETIGPIPEGQGML